MENTRFKYIEKSPENIQVRLDGRVAGAIRSKKGSSLYSYVPKGKSFSKGMYEAHGSLAACKKAIEEE